MLKFNIKCLTEHDLILISSTAAKAYMNFNVFSYSIEHVTDFLIRKLITTIGNVEIIKKEIDLNKRFGTILLSVADPSRHLKYEITFISEPAKLKAKKAVFKWLIQKNK